MFGNKQRIKLLELENRELTKQLSELRKEFNELSREVILYNNTTKAITSKHAEQIASCEIKHSTFVNYMEGSLNKHNEILVKLSKPKKK